MGPAYPSSAPISSRDRVKAVAARFRGHHRQFLRGGSTGAAIGRRRQILRLHDNRPPVRQRLLHPSQSISTTQPAPAAGSKQEYYDLSTGNSHPSNYIMADDTQSLRKSLDLPRDYVRVKPTIPQAGWRHAPPFRHAKCLALLPLQRWPAPAYPCWRDLGGAFCSLPHARPRAPNGRFSRSVGPVECRRLSPYPNTS